MVHVLQGLIYMLTMLLTRPPSAATAASAELETSSLESRLSVHLSCCTSTAAGDADGSPRITAREGTALLLAHAEEARRQGKAFQSGYLE